MSDSDALFDFAEPEANGPGSDEAVASAKPWRILIVDDEQGVHDVTEFALSRVTFRDRPLQFFHAFSGAEALTKVREIDDLALIFLDVVMESDDAGLKTVQALREDLDERSVRIILRTGQPGLAPERKIIVDYDINDYKSKTELSTDKLFVATIGALRTYEDLRTIEDLKAMAFSTLAHETGLEQQILDAMPMAVLHTDSLLSITGFNAQVAKLLDLAPEKILGSSLHAFLGTDFTSRLANHRDGSLTDDLVIGSKTRVHVVATPFVLSDQSHGGFIVRLDHPQ
jgi:CheY-like chemotaxis protein